MPALEFAGVWKSYGSRDALADVSFTLDSGSALGLLGPNGAGKTTTLSLALGFARPRRGSIRLRGIDPTKPASREGVGYLPERLVLPARTTLRAFLGLQARLAGLAGGEVLREIEAVCELTGVRDRLGERLGGLSKGLAQRVGFAQSLVGRPRFLLLDEPTSGLDPIGMRDARGWIEGARDRGCTVLVSSHILSEVERVCDRLAILHEGRIVAAGPVEEILQTGETLEDAFVRLVRA